MILRANNFLKLRIPNNFVTKMSEKLRSRGPFDNQHGKWYQTVLKSE